MKRFVLAFALFISAFAAAAPSTSFHFNNSGTLEQNTAIAGPHSLAPVTVTPILTMRPGKIFIRNDLFGTRTVGLDHPSFDDNEISFGPTTYPGAPAVSPYWVQPNTFVYWTGGGPDSGDKWSGTGTDPTAGHGAVARNSGDFRLFCQFSHFGYDDPLVFPGQPGKSHLHAFFGNTATGGNTTSYDIANKGNSTCSGGTANRTGYWVPAIIYHCPAAPNDTGCDHSIDGMPIRPDHVNVYYKGSLGSGSFIFDQDPLPYWQHKPANDIVAPPPGFRMIAGNPAGTPSSPGGGVGYSAGGCQSTVGTPSSPGDGSAGFPGTGIGVNKVPGCDLSTSTLFVFGVGFPGCWNGVDLDSPGHNAHVGGGIGDNRIDCTDVPGPSHNGINVPGAKVIPGITYLVHYYFKDLPGYRVTDVQWWRLSSDNYSDLLPAGFSGHGDWMNGWDQTILQGIIDFCLVRGLDCHDNIIGLGTTNTFDGNGMPSSFRMLRDATEERALTLQKPYAK